MRVIELTYCTAIGSRGEKIVPNASNNTLTMFDGDVPPERGEREAARG